MDTLKSELGRSELGGFSSVACLKAIITGMEDALGEKATAIALIAAGRTRGRQIVKQRQLAGKQISLQDLCSDVAAVLGKDGTRLLMLHKMEELDDGYITYSTETVCSAGEPSQGSERKCTFTLGVLQGVFEGVHGERFRGRHTESVLRGGEFDVFEYERLHRPL